MRCGAQTDARFVALDEALTNFKLSPDVIEWRLPRYFRNDKDRADEIEVKAARLDHWLRTFSMSLAEEDLLDTNGLLHNSLS